MREMREQLARAAGSPEARPDLDGLWARGRGRRRRARLATGVVAAVAVIGLAVGAVALADGGGRGEDVVAGPVAPSVLAPPPEPGDGPVTLEVESLAADGVPLVDPGGILSVTIDGPEGVARGAGLRWEAWDGTTWTAEHTLLPGGDEASPTVVGPEVGPSMSATWPLPQGIGPLRVPEAAPGWYRVCVELSGVMALPEEPAPAPVDLDPVCAQVRVPGDAAETPSEPDSIPDPVDPPPEPTGTLLDTLRVVDDASATPNTPLALELDTPQGGTLGGNTTWEQWNGVEWVPTHLYLDYLGPRPTHQFSITGAAGVPDVAEPVEPGVHRLSLPAPADTEVVSPWSRVCVDTSMGETVRPCVEIEVEGAPAEIAFGFGADDVREPTHQATWVVDPAGTPLTPESESVDIVVSQVACAGGELLDPEVIVDADRVIIRVDAEETDTLACRGATSEPVTVRLDAPLGDRVLVDGACGRSDVRIIDACDDGAQRWPLDE